jgi:hypothetical protein
MITLEDTEAAIKRCEQHLQRAATKHLEGGETGRDILFSASCGGCALYSLPYSYVMVPLLNQERA